MYEVLTYLSQIVQSGEVLLCMLIPAVILNAVAVNVFSASLQYQMETETENMSYMLIKKKKIILQRNSKLF